MKLKHLMKWILPLALLSAAAWAQQVTLGEAKATINDFKKHDARLEHFFANSVAYVVFPEIKKGAFVFGGAGGEGILFENGEPMGSVKMTQVSVGAQVGGGSYSQLIFISDESALYRFKKGQSSLSAEASAGIAGQEAKAVPPAEGGLTVFTRPIGGAMATAAVGGQKFDYHPYVSKPGS
jgi:lipid-binding SYLF domain-containing protein